MTAIKTIRFKTGEVIKIRNLTPLEWLDIERDESDTESMIYASEVAYCLEDWNGEGKLDPLALLSNRKNHALISQVSKVADKQRLDIPQLTLTEKTLEYQIWDDTFMCVLRPFTILEFLDHIASVKTKNPGELPSVFKCKALADCLIGWNGEGSISAEDLLSRKDEHKYIVAVDRALTTFFRSQETPTIEEGDQNDDLHHERVDDAISVPRPTRVTVK
ncbi:hypothetical protein [Chroococcidiopsis sp.]|uniref:hypothetical protein n=1 Tax=Chroococcidiopsis sp. TaxID=3088168 RepID=UPI003F3FF386